VRGSGTGSWWHRPLPGTARVCLSSRVTVPSARQWHYFEAHRDDLRRSYPTWSAEQLYVEASKHVSPPAAPVRSRDLKDVWMTFGYRTQSLQSGPGHIALREQRDLPLQVTGDREPDLAYVSHWSSSRWTSAVSRKSARGEACNRDGRAGNTGM